MEEEEKGRREKALPGLASAFKSLLLLLTRGGQKGANKTWTEEGAPIH